MAPLFSKVDLNKLRHHVQNEETLICAKYGKDLFNISKVIGRKKVAQFFFDSQCTIVLTCYKVKIIDEVYLPYRYKI